MITIDGMPSFYAIAVGRKPGIYNTWEDAKKQVLGYNGARFKKFPTYTEADAFCKCLGSPLFSQLGITPIVEHQAHDRSTDCPHTNSALVVFTDGACSANGRRGARGGFAVAWPNHPELSGSYKLPLSDMQTNNRAEFAAAIHALRQADTLDPSRSASLYIYTDSELLIKTATKWLSAWKRAGWQRRGGETIANLDQVKLLDELTANRRIVWKHVMAHTGAPDWASHWNAEVDNMARDIISTSPQ
jgi:ribonuclease HI